MKEPRSARRNFLKAAGAGLAGSVFLGGAVGAEKTRGAGSGVEAAPILDVRAFGARGDGSTVDTPAINRAIEAAAKQGGTVWLPAGNYLCYSIHLQSNVALYLAQGATIVGADAKGGSEVYDAAESNEPWEAYQDYGHNHWHNSLIWGEKLHNISILGPGLIWGKGLSRGWGTGLKAEAPGAGNKAIALKNCRNVTLRDFSILHGGHFGILATGVDNLTIDNLIIDTNRDGMDIDCCRNVRVSNCTVNSPWDDGICLKSSFGLGYARSTELVTITNCFVTGTYEEGTVLDGTWKKFTEGAVAAQKVARWGRIKFGTEANGGFRNITISNCVFEGCGGLALETVDGAHLEDVTVTNISMRDIVNAPIFMRLGSRMRGPSGVPVGTLRRITISNVVCSNAGGPVASILSGIPGHELEDIRISDVYIQHRGGGTAEDAAREPAENETKYPEPSMFGTTPAQGFYIRHVKGLEMSGIEIAALGDDARPAFVIEDVSNADFYRVRAPRGTGGTFALRRVENVGVAQSRPVADTLIDRAERRDL